MLSQEEISSLLYFIKANKGYTSEQMAIDIGISRQTFFNIIGERPCSMTTYKKVVEYIGDYYGK